MANLENVRKVLAPVPEMAEAHVKIVRSGANLAKKAGEEVFKRGKNVGEKLIDLEKKAIKTKAKIGLTVCKASIFPIKKAAEYIKR